MQAAAAGQLGVVKLLIDDLGVDRLKQDLRGANCLHYAAEGGSAKVVKWLVGDGRMDVGAVDTEGQTAMHYAARRVHSPVFDALRTLSSNCVNAKDYMGVSPLMRLAEASDDPRLVARFVKYGAAVDAVDEHGDTALMYAARKDHAQVCSQLVVTHKADTGLKNVAGKTALAIAEEHGGLSLSVLANEGLGADGRSSWKRDRKEVVRLDSKVLWEAGLPKRQKSMPQAGATKEVLSKTQDRQGEIPDGVSIDDFKRFEAMGREKRPSKCGLCHTCTHRSMKKACLLMRYFGDSKYTPRSGSGGKIKKRKRKDEGDQKGVSVNGSAAERAVTELDVEPLTEEQKHAERFFVAAEEGDVDTVRGMLRDGFDVNMADDTNEGTTALMYAAMNGQLVVVDELIVKRGADKNMTDVNGTTVLMCAAQEGYHKLIQLLCSKHDLEMELTDGGEENDMMETDKGGQPLKFRGHGMNPNVRNIDGDTALHFAAQHGHMKAVEALLSLGADPRLANNENETAQMAADKENHQSISRRLREANRHMKVVEEQFENGERENRSSNAGDVEAGQADAVAATPPNNLAPVWKPGEALSQPVFTHNPASMIDANNSGASPGALLGPVPKETSEPGQPVDLSITRTFTPENVREARMQTVSLDPQEKRFLRMIKLGKQDEARRLVKEAGVSVETCNKGGTTALMIVCLDGNEGMFQFLVEELHANPKAVDMSGMTVLMHATQEGFVDIAKKLVETHEADVNARTEDGDTALMYAAQGGHLDTVKMLLDHSADIDAEDNSGHTSLVLAAEGGHATVVAHLLERGAKIDPEWLVSLAKKA